MSKKKRVFYAAIDISTSLGALAVKGQHKKAFDCATFKLQGGYEYVGKLVYDLKILPELISSAIKELEGRGWVFGQVKSYCISIRQHDMVLLDSNFDIIGPAYTWQWNLAEDEAVELTNKRLDKIVGKIEARFVAPKLMKVLKLQPELRDRIERVVTTDAWIGYLLTGKLIWSDSELVSNALGRQKDRSIATEVIDAAGFEERWFPGVCKSGSVFGVVSTDYAKDNWWKIANTFEGAEACAALGDNHAAGNGCALIDYVRMVVSGGTSGIADRRIKRGWMTKGTKPVFAFNDDSLVLGMIPMRCADWYEEFFEQNRRGLNHSDIDRLTAANLSECALCRIEDPGEGKVGEYAWPIGFSLANKFRSIEARIAEELLKQAKQVLNEVVDERASKIFIVVLTGGLMKSEFLKSLMILGLKKIDSDIEVRIGSAPGKLASQEAALGALMVAMNRGRGDKKLYELSAEYCPTMACVFEAAPYEDAVGNFIAKAVAV